jgi:hypothetical protein
LDTYHYQKTSLQPRYNLDSDTSSSTESLDFDKSSSNSNDGRTKKVTRAIKTMKVEVKPETEKMSRLEAELTEMKVQLMDLQRPRRTTPSKCNNVWCERCGEEGHYSHECPLPQHKQVRMVELEERFPLFIQDAHEADGGIQVLYQIQPVGQHQRKAFGGKSKLPPPGSLGQPPYVPGEEMGMFLLEKGYCFNCYQCSHYADLCPHEKRRPNNNLCTNCRGQGHKFRDCPKEIIIQPLNLKPKTGPPKIRENLYLN